MGSWHGGVNVVAFARVYLLLTQTWARRYPSSFGSSKSGPIRSLSTFPHFAGEGTPSANCVSCPFPCGAGEGKVPKRKGAVVVKEFNCFSLRYYRGLK